MNNLFAESAGLWHSKREVFDWSPFCLGKVDVSDPGDNPIEFSSIFRKYQNCSDERQS